VLKDVDVPPVILPDVPTVSAPETAKDDREPDVAVISPDIVAEVLYQHLVKQLPPHLHLKLPLKPLHY